MALQILVMGRYVKFSKMAYPAQQALFRRFYYSVNKYFCTIRAIQFCAESTYTRTCAHLMVRSSPEANSNLEVSFHGVFAAPSFSVFTMETHSQVAIGLR